MRADNFAYGKILETTYGWKCQAKVDKDRLTLPGDICSKTKIQPRSKLEKWVDDDDSDSTSEYELFRLPCEKSAIKNATEVGESSSRAAATPKEDKKVPTDKNDADGQGCSRETENQDETALKKKANRAPNVSKKWAATTAKGSKKKAGRPRKQRLVSYSSQYRQNLVETGWWKMSYIYNTYDD